MSGSGQKHALAATVQRFRYAPISGPYLQSQRRPHFWDQSHYSGMSAAGESGRVIVEEHFGF
jgi:hypothetical protein